ncbi:epithelial cell-transforming sequence 2 oncogene-like [Rhinoraja longicauda]
METLPSQKVAAVFTSSMSVQRGLKHWQLESPARCSRDSEPLARMSIPKQTIISQHARFSAWTPIIHKAANQQLFDERVTLVGHWFDLWTDKQRKLFIHSILMRCSKSQLKFTRDWFTETVPMDKLDFTTVLPRFLSLYILSFLSPRLLSSSSQVNWHWRFLMEQDCLWMPKCVKQGWFLPYSPTAYEYGAWKRHYVACARSLDCLTPGEAAKVYSVIAEPKEVTEEREERRNERWLRRQIQERLTRRKKELLCSRPPWLSGKWNAHWFNTRPRRSLIFTSLEQPRVSGMSLGPMDDQTHAGVPLSHLLSEAAPSFVSCGPVLEKQRMLESLRTLGTGKNLTGGGPYPTLPQTNAAVQEEGGSNHPRVLLISSRIPAWEMALDCVRIDVMPVVYEHCGTTLDSLLFRVEHVLSGRRARSIGILAEGDPTELDLVQGYKISSKTLPDAKIQDFWENLTGCVLSQEDGGRIHIFAPLASSEVGMELLSQLSSLTGVRHDSPTGMVTGSYQHVLSEWLWEAEDPSPPTRYLIEKKLQAWTRMAEARAEVLGHARGQMEPHLRQLQRHVCGRMIGQLMFDSMSSAEVQQNQDVARALTEGLTLMSREKQEDPLGFLSNFLMSRSKNKLLKPGETFLTEVDGGMAPLKENVVAVIRGVDHTSRKLACREEIFEELTHLDRKLIGGFVEKRTRVAKEALTSEREYTQTLEIVKSIYWAPLSAALASNRAILSIANIHCIFTDILAILELNRNLLKDLTDRLQEWGPPQCLGDVFIKFSNKLSVYTNYFNNYGAILKTLDKCRNTIPSFRAFLTRHERTPMTKMLRLHEILLAPSLRFDEYTSLLHALQLHTPAEHADHHHLTTAIGSLKRFRDYIRQLKVQKERELQMVEAQNSIGGSPCIGTALSGALIGYVIDLQILLEANRYLIGVQEVAQMSSPDEKICATLRIYEYISDLSLFLFNDALLFASRTISHLPFEQNLKTSLQFLASVALSRLLIEDIPDSKYIQNAFVLQGPKRQWICATETEEDKVTWLSILESAICAAVEET